MYRILNDQKHSKENKLKLQNNLLIELLKDKQQYQIITGNNTKKGTIQTIPIESIYYRGHKITKNDIKDIYANNREYINKHAGDDDFHIEYVQLIDSYFESQINENNSNMEVKEKQCNN